MAAPTLIVMSWRLLPVTILLALLLAAAGCNGDDDEDDPTALPGSPTARASATAAPEETPSGEIREIAIAGVPDVQELLAETGGELVQENVLYADLTNDGVDEAVVPLASGGTLGDVAFLVLTPVGEKTRTLVREDAVNAGMSLEIVGDKLVMTEPVPGPDDPECCPSMLRKTTYAWNGAALAIEGVETVPNPAGGAAQ